MGADIHWGQGVADLLGALDFDLRLSLPTLLFPALGVPVVAGAWLTFFRNLSPLWGSLLHLVLGLQTTGRDAAYVVPT